MSGASSSTHVFCKEKERKPIISIYTLDGMPGGARTHNIDVSSNEKKLKLIEKIQKNLEELKKF